jgi:type IV secretory pathway TrbD component
LLEEGDVVEDDLETCLTIVFLVLSDWDGLVFLVVFWAVAVFVFFSLVEEDKELDSSCFDFDSF